jgi:hypothetical protein
MPYVMICLFERSADVCLLSVWLEPKRQGQSSNSVCYRSESKETLSASIMMFGVSHGKKHMLDGKAMC